MLICLLSPLLQWAIYTFKVYIFALTASRFTVTTKKKRNFDSFVYYLLKLREEEHPLSWPQPHPHSGKCLSYCGTSNDRLGINDKGPFPSVSPGARTEVQPEEVNWATTRPVIPDLSGMF